MAVKVEWIESAGGPLLLAPQSSVKDWFGTADTGGGSQTDYARACAIEDEIGTISIGDKSAVVLGDEPDRTTLVPERLTSDVYIVRWRCAKSEESLLSALFAERAVRTLSFIPNGWIATDADEYWLFDSAYPGAQIGTRLRIDLEAGRYFLGTAAFKPSSSTSALIHRMSKSPSGT